LSLTFRLAVDCGAVESSPCRKVRRERELNARDRFLSEAEERTLRAVIRRDYPHREPELDIALNTGLCQSSQYGLLWSDVDFENNIVRLRRTKPGEKQFVRLNTVARAAFERLRDPEFLALRARLSPDRRGV